MNAIEIRGLTKNFGPKQAVCGLDMTVPQGAIYGFIGENGSGKSTTEKLICGLLVPNGGSIKLFGKDYTDADGMRIMREVLVDITREYGCTVVISSHILGELEKIATHYGIIRGGQDDSGDDSRAARRRLPHLYRLAGEGYA